MRYLIAIINEIIPVFKDDPDYEPNRIYYVVQATLNQEGDNKEIFCSWWLGRHSVKIGTIIEGKIEVKQYKGKDGELHNANNFIFKKKA
jgi:hypothetical protein